MYMYDMSNAYLYFWNICNFKLSVRWRGLGDITRYKSKQFLIHVLPFGKHNVFLQSQVGFFFKSTTVFIRIQLLSILTFFVQHLPEWQFNEIWNKCNWKKKYVNDWYVFFKVMAILKCMHTSFFSAFLDSN